MPVRVKGAAAGGGSGAPAADGFRDGVRLRAAGRRHAGSLIEGPAAALSSFRLGPPLFMAPSAHRTVSELRGGGRETGRGRCRSSRRCGILNFGGPMGRESNDFERKIVAAAGFSQ